MAWCSISYIGVSLDRDSSKPIPSPTLRKAAEILASRHVNMISDLEDRRDERTATDAAAAVSRIRDKSECFYFNTSRTWGSTITAQRMVDFDSYSVGEADFSTAKEIDDAARNLHRCHWRKAGGNSRWELRCSCMAFWHVRCCSHEIAVKDELSILHTNGGSFVDSAVRKQGAQRSGRKTSRSSALGKQTTPTKSTNSNSSSRAGSGAGPAGSSGKRSQRQRKGNTEVFKLNLFSISLFNFL